MFLQVYPSRDQVWDFILIPCTECALSYNEVDYVLLSFLSINGAPKRASFLVTDSSANWPRVGSENEHRQVIF